MIGKKSQKGQIYSLDFLIAAGLLVLAVGMLLNYFETAAMQGKEARLKNELTAVALTASNVMASKTSCADNFRIAGEPLQGYSAYGCYDTSPGKIAGLTRQHLMIPDGFGCRVQSGNDNISVAGCSLADPTQAVHDVAVVERNLLKASSLHKSAYEKCIFSGAGCNYTDNQPLIVKVWRT